MGHSKFSGEGLLGHLTLLIIFLFWEGRLLSFWACREELNFIFNNYFFIYLCFCVEGGGVYRSILCVIAFRWGGTLNYIVNRFFS